MISATVLRFHGCPKAGPEIDQLKFKQLADGPSLKGCQFEEAITIVQEFERK